MAAARPLGVGVIGATGNIGRRYRAELREIPAQARIVALCARRRERLQQARVQDGAKLITTDWAGGRGASGGRRRGDASRAYPRPNRGMPVAITVMNGTFASSGSDAM